MFPFLSTTCAFYCSIIDMCSCNRNALVYSVPTATQVQRHFGAEITMEIPCVMYVTYCSCLPCSDFTSPPDLDVLAEASASQEKLRSKIEAIFVTLFCLFKRIWKRSSSKIWSKNCGPPNEFRRNGPLFYMKNKVFVVCYLRFQPVEIPIRDRKIKLFPILTIPLWFCRKRSFLENYKTVAVLEAKWLSCL